MAESLLLSFLFDGYINVLSLSFFKQTQIYSKMQLLKMIRKQTFQVAIDAHIQKRNQNGNNNKM